MIRALLLDLDDTLFDRGRALEAWARVRLGRALAPDEVATLHAIDGRGHRAREAFAADAAALGLAVDAATFPDELAGYVTAEPDVAPTLAALARHVRLAVVTNGGAAQRVKLARLGLDSIVHAVFVSSELGVAKPARAMFERALRWTEVAAREVLVVGDRPELDLVPARALGMRTAWRVRGVWPAEHARPDVQIGTIGELAAIVDASREREASA